ncbi:hypothetical protein HZA45_03075, partial [Candidatus Peregrinibacteria bacterium]|nr:hypothetical protein [Candidatus Peregrinibacteria bacterium]
MNRTQRIQLFTETICDWYARHKRTLPWRDLMIKNDAERAYRILVSEVMLQQTQVSRVIVIYKRFLREFPTLRSLANASNRDVILAWRGMGYNSRALRLRDAAATIMKEHGGTFPCEMNELLLIKGIGPYTAAAIRNFAFNIPTPCIDTNIRRILHRTFVGPENADGTWKKDDAELMAIASEVLNHATKALSPRALRLRSGQAPTRGDNARVRGSSPLAMTSFDAANWHAALMDFGSLVQTKNNPRWDVCPLTAKGIMKTTRKNFLPFPSPRGRGLGGGAFVARKSEPGRVIGSRFVPNRIIRGRIIEALRDAKKGLTFQRIGKEVCMDWNPDEHRGWLEGLLYKLAKDEMIAMQ